MLPPSHSPKESSVTRYINHSLRRQNCRATDIYAPLSLFGRDYRLPLGVVFVKATRPIAQGDELFMDYGSTYWDSRVTGPQRLVVDYF